MSEIKDIQEAGGTAVDPSALFDSPYAHLLQLSVKEAGGRLILTMPPHMGVLGRPGYLHGGAIGGLLEIAAWTTVRAALIARSGAEAPPSFKPISVGVEFLRGGRMVDTHAAGHITRMGSRIAHVAVEAWQADEGAPIANASLKFLIHT